jgi:hypothetical protein
MAGLASIIPWKIVNWHKRNLMAPDMALSNIWIVVFETSLVSSQNGGSKLLVYIDGYGS